MKQLPITFPETPEEREQRMEDEARRAREWFTGKQKVYRIERLIYEYVWGGIGNLFPEELQELPEEFHDTNVKCYFTEKGWDKFGMDIWLRAHALSGDKYRLVKASLDHLEVLWSDEYQIAAKWLTGKQQTQEKENEV